MVVICYVGLKIVGFGFEISLGVVWDFIGFDLGFVDLVWFGFSEVVVVFGLIGVSVVAGWFCGDWCFNVNWLLWRDRLLWRDKEERDSSIFLYTPFVLVCLFSISFWDVPKYFPISKNKIN